MASSRLLALPGELRNEIYELAFTFEHKESTDLCQAEPPSKALLLACRQVYGEVSKMYQVAYQQYWFEGVFTLEFNATDMINTAEHQLSRFKTDDFQNINKLTITSSKTSDFGLCVLKTTLLDPRGLWKRERIPEHMTSYVSFTRKFPHQVARGDMGMMWPMVIFDDDEIPAYRALLSNRGPILFTMEAQIRDLLAMNKSWLTVSFRPT